MIVTSHWSHIDGLKLADPTFCQPGKVDLLLGADVYAKLIQDGLKRGPDGVPIAQNTILGWIISVEISNKQKQSEDYKTFTIAVTDNEISQKLQNFWELEEIPTRKLLTQQEEACENHFVKNHTRLDNGRYMVRLPFIDEVHKNALGSSRFNAVSSLLHLERRFANNPSLKREYHKCLNEYMDLGHMHQVTTTESNYKTCEKENVSYHSYYLPHHAVFKESTTTKLRVVFDASRKTNRGLSLNDVLLTGPSIQNDLITILLRWRRYKFAFIADIEKMYRQVKINDSDNNYQRIVWRQDSSEEVKDYCLNTVTFGVTCAPFLAIRTLHQLANDDKEDYPIAAKSLLDEFYVDDLLSGDNTIHDAILKQKQLRTLLQSGGFKLRKWISNDERIMEAIPSEDREHLNSFDLNLDQGVKSLGIIWHPTTDTFSYKLNLDYRIIASTKRELLSDIAKIYDPLGWIAPLTISTKILMQSVWLHGLDWDAQLSTILKSRWEEIKAHIFIIQKLRIPRWIETTGNNKECELHAFSDASQQAYAAVVYLKTINEQGQAKCRIIMAKSKVAPIKTVSIPRLELCGALLAARLIKYIIGALELPKTETYMWTDSSIVLAWIRAHPNKWTTFVSNRTSEIIQTVGNVPWHHVPSNQNPADLASRGLLGNEIVENQLWWTGPNWLCRGKTEWPNTVEIPNTDRELKKTVKVYFTAESFDFLQNLERFSTLAKLIRVTAYCYRFIRRAKGQVIQYNWFTAEEWEKSLCSWVKILQNISFSQEIAKLKEKKPIDRKSKLLNLNPFLDQQGVLRVGGRLQNSGLNFNERHPVILPKTGHLTQLILQHYHCLCLHGGVQLLLTLLRKRYWLLDARNTIRHFIRRCITCYRQNAQTCTQQMGSLPKVRINMSRPFTHTGVDYCGPIELKFTCSQPRRLACVSLSKRVAHEMLEDYGSTVGYQIRFERSKTSKTKICFITEGLLLRQLALDANLFNYDALILDEIHERNLYGDILLGVVKCLVRARRDFKLILMSATINVDLFTNYFQEEDISYLEVPGRLYPIKVFYMPPHSLQLKGPSSKSNSANRFDPEPYIQILSIIDNKYPKNEKGDLLVFVSGVNEINTVIEAAKQYNETCNNWIILPLHSGLSLADQDKVFDYSPDGLRKCIVSTNIAETSLTIDGIRFVVDSGKVKEMLFDSSCKIQKLKEFLVSKSSAEQRKGRAGRTGPGICYRLYSQQDFENFEAYPIPEIHRVSLESILLQMMAMGLPDVRIFPFIEVPANENIEQAIRVLKQHEALTQNEKITSLGRALSALPVEITIGKMLLMSCVFRELNRALTFSAILSIQSPYTSRAFTDPKCERSRSTLRSDQGDPFTAINLYREWLELKWNKKSSTRKWCYAMGIEEQRFYELTKLRNQFANALENCNIIDTKSNEFTSSAEKSIRYGEVRLLKAMKRSQIMLAPTRRKILKRDSETFESLDDLGDIRDVDFRLKNDSNQLRMLLISAKAEKRKDILMLKLIIVSGFYPQIAIPDEFNFCQSESQQFFHTVSKPFVSLHPNSNFVNCCDKLRLKESDIVEKPVYYNSRLQLSSAHQILCYQTLLETTKAYLINTIRMPAAQTLLLFSFTIDTNALVTHIVCDSWLSLEFPTPGSGQELLLTAIRLRRLWQKLLTEKLNGMQEGEKTNIEEKTDDYFDQDQLLNDLVEFMNFNIIYTIKRLLPGDLKDLYTLTEINQEYFMPNPFAKDFEVSANREKGGLNVSENVVYGCLKAAPWNTMMQELAKNYSSHCNVCDITISNLGIARISHANDCLQRDTNKKINTSSTSHGSSTNLKSFFCSTCERNLTLSKINILKHKNKCRTANK